MARTSASHRVSFAPFVIDPNTCDG